MFKKKSIFVLIILSFLFKNTSLFANIKLNIIQNYNNIDTLEFNFVQIAFDKKETGICFLKRPHFLNCQYNNKNKKELIVNRKNLVIYHKRYNKTYFYPVSKSFFIDILDKVKFKNLVLNANLNLNNEAFEIKHVEQNKGEIIFFFDKKSFDLSGWAITDLNGNYTLFKINNLKKNQNLDKKLFYIPQIN